MVDESATVALFATAEERFLNARRKLPVPVLLVSGALGAGKTTLLNHILRNKLNLRVTAIVNDLASVNVDADVLVNKNTERTLKLSNGCACHSLAGALEDGVWQVLQETSCSQTRSQYMMSVRHYPHQLVYSCLLRQCGKRHYHKAPEKIPNHKNSHLSHLQNARLHQPKCYTFEDLECLYQEYN